MTSELELIEKYKKSNRRILFSSIVLNGLVVVLLFSNFIQKLVSWVTYTAIFDYYITYTILLVLINFGFITLYFINSIKLNLIVEKELNKTIDEKEKELNKIKAKYDMAMNTLSVAERVVDFSFKRESEYKKKKTDFILYKKFIDDKIIEDRRKFGFKAFYVGWIYVWLSFFGLLFSDGRISTSNIISQYENKYSKIEYELIENQDKKALKDKTVINLEKLRDEYIAEFGSGSDIIFQINKDIAELKK